MGESAPVAHSSLSLARERQFITASSSNGVFAASGPAAVYHPETLRSHLTPRAATSPRSAYPPLRPPLGRGGTPERVDLRPIAQELPLVVPKNTGRVDSSTCAENENSTADRSNMKVPSTPRKPHDTPRIHASAKLNVTWPSIETLPRGRGMRRRYFFTHRAFDDERASEIPGHFDVLLDDPSRTTSRTDYLRCTYVDYLSTPAGGIDQDCDAAAELTEQLRTSKEARSSRLDIELAARWVQSIRPRTRYDAAPMLVLAQALLKAMCTPGIQLVVGSVEDALSAARQQALQLRDQGQLLDSTTKKLEDSVTSLALQQSKNAELEEQLRQLQDKFKESQAEAVAKEQMHVAEIDDLKTRLKKKNKKFSLVQDELGRLMIEHQALVEQDRAAGIANEKPSETTDITASWTPWKTDNMPRKGHDKQPADTPAHMKPTSQLSNGDGISDAGDPWPAAAEQEDSPTKEAGVVTDDAWGELTRSLESARSDVVRLTEELALVQADGRQAARKHTVALSMVRASMAAAFAQAAQEGAEGSGEKENVREEMAKISSELHQTQNNLHVAVVKNEEMCEQMDELFDMYNNLREERTLELQALEEELQRLGLTLELPKPKTPKRGSWMANKIAKTPYNTLLSGQFKISLR